MTGAEFCPSMTPFGSMICVSTNGYAAASDEELIPCVYVGAFGKDAFKVAARNASA